MRAPGRACVHLGVLARSAGCALGAPNLFLDSVLFLSHCLDTVHEHCSSQKNFKKKLKQKLIKSNQIKSNQIKSNETKFWKNENFENKIFVDKKNDLICGISCLALHINAGT